MQFNWIDWLGFYLAVITVMAAVIGGIVMLP